MAGQFVLGYFVGNLWESKGDCMKLVHVIPHMDDEATGPSQSVARLCEALVVEGQDVELHTMAARSPPSGVELVVHEEWRPTGRFGFSAGLIQSLRHSSADADILHNHSLWSYPNMAAGLAVKSGAATLVTSPRGTLAPAARARSTLKKWIFKPIQWQAITRAACLHATSNMEYADIRELGLRHPVAVIPNGIDIPLMALNQSRYERGSRIRRVLFLGRLHPIKGIELLLEAWATLQHQHPDWELVVAGKGEGAYVQSLRDMATRLKLQRIDFPGPVYGQEKSRLYFSSDLFVLPTKTENFGMAIAEAQAHAIPVVTTRGAPWSGLVAHGSGWWVERTQDDIGAALDSALRMDARTLQEMGLRGREWMKDDYDWATIVRKMIATYTWLRIGGARPSCIHFDG